MLRPNGFRPKALIQGGSTDESTPIKSIVEDFNHKKRKFEEIKQELSEDNKHRRLKTNFDEPS